MMSTPLSGGYSDGVPPLPIPNREVKPARADGTAMQCGRVGSRLFFREASRIAISLGLFSLGERQVNFLKGTERGVKGIERGVKKTLPVFPRQWFGWIEGQRGVEGFLKRFFDQRSGKPITCLGKRAELEW